MGANVLGPDPDPDPNPNPNPNPNPDPNPNPNPNPIQVGLHTLIFFKNRDEEEDAYVIKVCTNSKY